MNTSEKRIERACQLLLVVGVVTFAAALATGQAARAWQAYLLNLLFWTGIAECGVVFSAAYQITRGQWSGTLRRMAESLWFFLPVAVALFLVLMLFGARSVFWWAAGPAGEKGHWLNVPFVTLRGLAVFAVVFSVSIAYVYCSQRPARDHGRTAVLAPLVVIAFGVGFSLLGFDLVMSLDPHWYSTLFGWYFFVGAFYSLLAWLAVSACAFRKAWGLERHLDAAQSHDLGKLLFGFCLLTGGFLWAQWLVFWYGNLPEEVRYVIRRYYEMPYAPAAWVMTYGGFVLPMVVLLSQALKRNPKLLAVAGGWILVMMWLERYVWIVPSVWKGEGAPWLIEALISAGFLGGFVWGWLAHNRRMPLTDLAPARTASGAH